MTATTDPQAPAPSAGPGARRSWLRPQNVVGVVIALAVAVLVLRVGGGQLRFGEDLRSPDPTTTWDWNYFWALVPDLLRALAVTVQATVAGFAIAVVLGFFLALGRRSGSRLVRWPVTFLIEFVRSTPLLIQLFFVFYALPPALGITISPMRSLILGLGVHYACYASEAYRAGINSVPKGQWEAATAMNLGPLTTWTRVIIPQAVPNILPALGNYLVAGFKDAPLGSTIQVTGVLFFARTISNRTFRVVEPFTLVGIGFLLVSIPSALLIRRLEKRIAYERIS